MARLDNMATIDLALAGNLNTPAPAPEDSAPDLEVVPGVAAPAPLTADQKRGFDAARQTKLDQQKEFDATQKAALDRQKLLEQAMTAKKQEQDAFDASAIATVKGAKKIVRGTSVKLAGIPTPGGITLPLVILLVFFFMLVPVNGHTRMTWLWLVLSGNAMISGGVLGESGGAAAAPAAGDSVGGDSVGGAAGPITVPGLGPVVPLTTPGNLPPLTVFTPTLPSFTGVEEL